MRRTQLHYAGTAPAASAPVYASGTDGVAVILGQPIVGSTVAILDGILSTAGNPAPSVTYQWYRGVSGYVADPGTAIAGATSSSYTPTAADTMAYIWCVVTRTNIMGSATSTGWKTRCIPSGATIGQGYTADAGQINDPSVASAYSATTLYNGGDVVTYGGNSYIARVAYAYGITPGTDGQTWNPVNHTYYIDADLGSDGNAGTKALPFQTLSPMVDILNAHSNLDYTMFLLKRGTAATYSGSVVGQSNGGTGWGVGVYGSGTRPAWNYDLPDQTQITAAGFGSTCVEFNHVGDNAGYVMNIDFNGRNYFSAQITNASIVNGPFVPGDVVTFTSHGMTGTVKSVLAARVVPDTVLVLALDPFDVTTFSNSGTITSGAKSATISSCIPPGGVVGSGSTNYGYYVGNCSFTDFGNAAFDMTLTDTTKGHCYFVNSYSLRCGGAVFSGAAMGGSGTDVHVLFSTIQDGGIIGGLQGHPVYQAHLFDSSFLFNNVFETGNFGNTGYNCHGNSDTNEVAYNIFKGCRSGIGVNDGYADGESMYRWNIHHNLVRDIGTGTGQSAGSVAWLLTCLQNSRIHNNVTINSSGVFNVADVNVAGVGSTNFGNSIIAHNSQWNSRFFFGSTADGTKCALMTNVVTENNAFTNSNSNVALTVGYTMPAGQYTEDANLFYRTDAGSVITWSYGSGAANYSSAAAFNAGVPAYEADGVTGNPLYVSTTSGSENLALQSGSPAKAKGIDLRHALGYAADFAFTLRSATAPSIGAYE